MSVKVKKLEWIKTKYWWEAKTPFGTFDVQEQKKTTGEVVAWGCFIPNVGNGNQRITERGAKSAKEAQDACQRWFDAMIFDCLEVVIV